MATTQIKTDTLYVDSDEDYFFSPDGVGRVFFTSFEEAVEQTGLSGANVVEWHGRDEYAYQHDYESEPLDYNSTDDSYDR